MSERTSVYVLSDANGQALYVGISNRPARRLWQHSRTAPWFDSVHTVTFTHHASRAEAEAEERRIITTTEPLHNIRHNPIRQLQGRTIDFPQEVYAQLLRAAHEDGRTFANLVRHIVAIWLERRQAQRDEQEAA